MPGAITNGADPSTTDLTFNVASEGVFVQQEFVYGFTFGDPNGDPGGSPADASGETNLNIALASSATNVSVGKDTNPGSINLDDATPPSDEFPACASPLPTTGFEQVDVDCGPWNPSNPGAYGNAGALSDDIPAVEFNVVGGTTGLLYPGGPSAPINFAITNPGSSTVHVGTVSTSLVSVTSDGIGGDPTCTTGMYSIANSPVGPIGNVVPGTTVFDATGITISMIDNNANQDNCEGAVVTLSFSSN